MEVIMKYRSFYPMAAVFAVLIGIPARTAATDAMAELAANTTKHVIGNSAKMGWIEWMGSQLNFGSLSLGNGIVTLDSTKGSSLFVSALGSSLEWVRQNPKIAAAMTIYSLYRLKMNRIQDEKIKELILAITTATGAAQAANSVDGQKQAIHRAIQQLASEANLSCISWFLSLRWMPRWVPIMSNTRNTLSVSAGNLAIIEEIAKKNVDSITLDDAKKIHEIFTAPGL